MYYIAYLECSYCQSIQSCINTQILDMSHESSLQCIQLYFLAYRWDLLLCAYIAIFNGCTPTFLTFEPTVTISTWTVSWWYTVATIQTAIGWKAYCLITALSMPQVMTDTSVVTIAVTMKTPNIIASSWSKRWLNRLRI